MHKYNIEGNIDFFAELYKSLDVEDETQKVESDNNLCLISDTPLTDKFVTLLCGHKFNYIPLYHDLVNHKLKFNGMESSLGKLHQNEIRCPYCRKKQNTLLPYYEELGLKKVNGVNAPFQHESNGIYKKCEYQIPNPLFNEDMPESSINSKSLCCGNLYATQISQPGNITTNYQPENFGDEKSYCFSHKKIMISKYKKEKKDNELAEKLKLKEEKQKLKEEKQKLKKEKVNNKKKTLSTQQPLQDENMVLGPTQIQIDENEFWGCVQILKTGSNKGKPCGLGIFNENLCKRHHKLQKNIQNNDVLEDLLN